METMKTLLNEGADLNLKNSNNQTPLYLAASNETENNLNVEEQSVNENLEVVRINVVPNNVRLSSF